VYSYTYANGATADRYCAFERENGLFDWERSQMRDEYSFSSAIGCPGTAQQIMLCESAASRRRSCTSALVPSLSPRPSSSLGLFLVFQRLVLSLTQPSSSLPSVLASRQAVIQPASPGLTSRVVKPQNAPRRLPTLALVLPVISRGKSASLFFSSSLWVLIYSSERFY
jgi:hypothetical protein